MNKAFVKEPEQTGDATCPRCGSLGTAVTEITLDAQLPADKRRAIGEVGWFCPYAACSVVYFDLFERVVTVESLPKSVWPKDPEAPICGCFGLTREDIEADLAEGGVRRVRAVVARAKSAEARCATCAVSGQSCIGEVQRYYMQRRG
jgi:hypothetical protein